jgi:DNA primase
MTIPEIKAQLPLSEVIRYYGFKADKHHRIRCPFHEDKTPSMQLYYKTQSCYCFSSNCSTHGKSLDVIGFILHKEGLSKAEAIRKAVELLGGAGAASPVSHPVNPLPVQVEKPGVSKAQVLGNMFSYFKNAVHNSKPAQEYIRSRGLDATKIEVRYNTAQFHHGARRRKR